MSTLSSDRLYPGANSFTTVSMPGPPDRLGATLVTTRSAAERRAPGRALFGRADRSRVVRMHKRHGSGVEARAGKIVSYSLVTMRRWCARSGYRVLVSSARVWLRARSKTFWCGLVLAAISFWAQLYCRHVPGALFVGGRARSKRRPLGDLLLCVRLLRALGLGRFAKTARAAAPAVSAWGDARRRKRQESFGRAPRYEDRPRRPAMAPQAVPSFPPAVINLDSPTVDAPKVEDTLRLADLHPWVRDPALPLWRTGHFRNAVEEAAKSVNAATQQKLGRQDKSEWGLLADAFNEAAPQPGVPRLRPIADPGTPTYHNLRDGAFHFGRGCYQGIRNVAAHQTVNWDSGIALQYLVTFSVLATWIDQCYVERAPTNLNAKRS